MQFDFQNPATSVMEGIIDFHHDIMFFIIVIVVFVAWVLFAIVFQFGFAHYVKDNSTTIPALLQIRRDSLILKNVTHGTLLEIIWTILPVFVLIAIAIPSFALLYAIDEVIDPCVTVKVVGHQWYWSYEYPISDKQTVTFDSYMVEDKNLKPGDTQFEKIIKKSDERIEKYYTIYSYHKFVALIQEEKIKKLNDTLLIIDEVQNMISLNGTFYKSLKKVVEASNDAHKTTGKVDFQIHLLIVFSLNSTLKFFHC
jgi:hypothetical protein